MTTYFMRAILALCILILVTNGLIRGQEGQTGSLKGKVRAENGSTLTGVAVIAYLDEKEVARTETNRKGEFVLPALVPGVYTLSFRKPGLRVGSISHIEVKAGKVRQLRDRLILPVDEGTLAFVRGSVFREDGHSFPGVRVELTSLDESGSARTIDTRITDESGSFSFRLKPVPRRYKVTARASGMQPASETVDVDGAAVYRIALSLAPRKSDS